MQNIHYMCGSKKFWSSTYLYTEVILSNTKDLELICIEQ